MAADDQLQQRPETPEQRRAREREVARVVAQERRKENSRILRALRSDPHLWEFAVGTALLVDSARDKGGGLATDPTGLPLSNPQLALVDRVKLCRRVNELTAEGAGCLVVAQYGPPLKEEAREVRGYVPGISREKSAATP